MNGVLRWIHPVQSLVNEYKRWIHPVQRLINEYKRWIHPVRRLINEYKRWIHPVQRLINEYKRWIHPVQRLVNEYQRWIHPVQRLINEYQRWINANTVRLACLPCEDPPNPPINWGANFLLYPLFKGVATGGGILSEPYWDESSSKLDEPAKIPPTPLQKGG